MKYGLAFLTLTFMLVTGGPIADSEIGASSQAQRATLEIAPAERVRVQATAMGPAGVAAKTGMPRAISLPGPARFPLSARPGKRYLEDADSNPFLIHGDTAWSLIAQLGREPVEQYLNDRQSRGFNTILVSLIEHRFASNAPANAYGQPPFLIPGNYATPNEHYFAHADWVLRRAADRGFLVLVAPSYAGSGGGGEGWYREMVSNGPRKLRQYGRYLGQRYRNFTNILWVHGVDYNPPNKHLVRAIAEGIRDMDRRALHTAQGAPETAAIEYWQGESWLDINNVYTYRPVFSAALRQYARRDRMPFFLIESAYENENGTTERRLRAQAWDAVLSGACGQIFGNNPIWHFDGPGLYPASTTWQEAMGGRGTISMTHLYDLLASLPWWLLEPDLRGTLLTTGHGSEDDRAVAAHSSDRSFAVLYMPSARKITVQLDQLAGPHVSAHWYDPSNGEFQNVEGTPFPSKGARSFEPRVTNAGAEFGDWVLILESVSASQ